MKQNEIQSRTQLRIMSFGAEMLQMNGNALGYLALGPAVWSSLSFWGEQLAFAALGKLHRPGHLHKKQRLSTVPCAYKTCKRLPYIGLDFMAHNYAVEIRHLSGNNCPIISVAFASEKTDVALGRMTCTGFFCKLVLMLCSSQSMLCNCSERWQHWQAAGQLLT